MSDWNQGIIEEFRGNDGVVGGVFEQIPLLLLHHAGAKTGTERINPLAYRPVEGGYAVFASKSGADTNPDWFYNLKANPEAEVEVGTNTVAVRARVAQGDEHDRIWSEAKIAIPPMAEYEAKTARAVIPVVVLERT